MALTGRMLQIIFSLQLRLSSELIDVDRTRNYKCRTNTVSSDVLFWSALVLTSKPFPLRSLCYPHLRELGTPDQGGNICTIAAVAPQTHGGVGNSATLL